MLVITSAGDNALHYAIAARPNRVNDIFILFANRVLTDLLSGQIHCVDMNP